MRNTVRRGLMVAGTVAVLSGSAAGAAAAGSGPVLTWAPTTAAGTDDYGTVTAGQTASQTFTLTNTGTKATGTLTVSVTGPAAFAKGTDGCTGATLNPGAVCRVTISYAPASGTDTSSGTLSATSARPAATASVALTGKGAKASPGIATAPSAIGTGGAGGTAVTDTVALAGGDQPGGTVQFQLFGPSTSKSCTGNPVFAPPPVTVTGDGTYTSPSYTPATPGSYWWTATYHGDANNTTAATNCGDETVGIGANTTPYLYWADAGAGTIMRSNLDGTGVTTLIPNAGTSPWGVAVDGSHLYWTDYGSGGGASDGAVMRANLDGSGVTTLVPNQVSGAGIAVDSNHIYWSAGGNIMEAGLDGSNPQTLVPNQGGAGVAVDGSHIYWSDWQPSGGGAVMKANLDGTGVTTLDRGAAFDPWGITVAGSHIFWGQQGSGTSNPGIYEANLDGTGVTTLDSTAGDAGVAVDSSHIFWDNQSAGTVNADTLLGGVTTLTSGLNLPQFMAVSG